MQDFRDKGSPKVAIIALPAGRKLKEFGVHAWRDPFTFCPLPGNFCLMAYYACMVA